MAKKIERKCPKCGRTMKEHDVLMTFTGAGKTAGPLCIQCLKDAEKRLTK